MLEQLRLDGQVAIVTGGGRGIGRSIALALAEAGADLCITGRTAAEIEAVAHDATTTFGVKAIAVTADQCSADEVRAAVAATVAELGPVDILVNNAGQPTDSPFLEMTEESAAALIDVNLMGPIRYLQAVGPAMVERRQGVVINVSSMDSVIGTPNLSVYGATKGGVTQLTKALAAEWARYGIRLNALCPGFVATSANDEVLADDRLRESIVRRIPMRRVGTPNEIGVMAVYLASSASSFVTGATFLIDGGETAV